MKKGKLKKILGATAMGLCALTMPFALAGCAEEEDINIRVTGDFVQWQSGDNGSWHDLLKLSEIKDILGNEYKGKPGINGKEVEFRTTETHIQWRYVDANQSEEENWIDLIAVSAIKGNDGDTPFIGENGNWWVGETDTGVRAEVRDIVDTSAEYKYDFTTNEEYLEVTTIYSDGTREIVKVSIPRKVTSIEYSGPAYIKAYSQGNQPILQIKVNFDDGTYRYINVEDKTFTDVYKYNQHEHDYIRVLQDINFNEVGRYKFKLYYSGKYCEESLTIYESNSDLNVTKIEVPENKIMIVKEGELVESFTEADKLTVYYENGETEQVSFTNENVSVNTSNFDAVGEIFEATITYDHSNNPMIGGIARTTFNILPVESLEDANVGYLSELGCEVNQSPEIPEDFAIEYYIEDENSDNYYYHQKVTEDMLVGLDNTQEGAKIINVDSSKTYGNEDVEITVNVYDLDNMELHSFHISNTDFIVGKHSLSDIKAQVIYRKQETGVRVYKDITLTQDMIIGDQIDFNKAGTYTITSINYNGVELNLYYGSEFSGTITIYNPEVQNIKSIRCSEYGVIFDLSKYTLEECVISQFCGAELSVEYFDENYLNCGNSVPVTRDMIDISKIDINNYFPQSIGITYGLPGQEKVQISVQVQILPNMTGAKLLKTCEIDSNSDLLGSIESVLIYDNGIVKLEAESESIYDQYLKYDQSRLLENVLSLDVLPLSINNIFSIQGNVIKDFEIAGEVKEVFTCDLTGVMGMEKGSYGTFEVYGDENYTGQGKYFAKFSFTQPAGSSTVTQGNMIVEVEVDRQNMIFKSASSEFEIEIGNTLVRK